MSLLCPRRASPRLSASTEVATPPTLGSSVCTNCKIFTALDHETFRPLEIFAVAGERFYRLRRNAAVKLVSIGKTLVEERFRSEHGEVRQCASAEQHAISTDKTVVTDSHRFGRLPVLFKIDAVANNL